MKSLYAILPIAAQNLACTAAGIRRYHTRFTSHFHRVLAQWERTQDAPIETLHELQRERLNALVDEARLHTAHYREIRPPSNARDPFTAIQETLSAIPLLEKKAYRDCPESFLSDRFRTRALRRGMTSGTTGTALPLWYTPEAIAEEYAAVWRLRRSLGVRLSDPNMTFNGQVVVPFNQSKPPFWRNNAYGRQTLFSVFHLAPANLSAYIDAIHTTHARYVQGYPSSIHLVARAMLEAGRPIPPGRIAGVFTSSETLLAFQRQTIESAFGTRVRDRYGVSELAVSMTECPEQRLHVDMEFCIVELHNSQTTGSEERGELIVTGLSTRATPFLRYRIGDIGVRVHEPCPCGRPGDVFVKVEGRVDDYVTTPDGRLVGRLDHIFKEQLDVAEAQILQSSRDAIEVLVVPKATYTEASERRLEREIRSRLGPELGIEIRVTERIPRAPNGKFRSVISRVRTPQASGVEPEP